MHLLEYQGSQENGEKCPCVQDHSNSSMHVHFSSRTSSVFHYQSQTALTHFCLDTAVFCQTQFLRSSGAGTLRAEGDPLSALTVIIMTSESSKVCYQITLMGHHDPCRKLSCPIHIVLRVQSLKEMSWFKWEIKGSLVEKQVPKGWADLQVNRDGKDTQHLRQPGSSCPSLP